MKLRMYYLLLAILLVPFLTDMRNLILFRTVFLVNIPLKLMAAR